MLSVGNLISRLRDVVGPDALLTSPSELLVYECDGFTIEKNKPDVVVFPTSTEQVVAASSRSATSWTCPSCRAGPAPAWPAAALPVGGGVMIAPRRA